ncbi:PAS domain S-box protein [Gelidibacter salicanalis]|uniref:histidine kinase n=1 Tax=Gelidibacter salicanalis TaxID=291193 RepID=A0A5C7AJ39_9FLAO|nr:PAS domain S-box protein [Gelidibacter salicanalis]TXE06605.1 PAS domain S-box protein [Gelidibacter salicanalis]
MKNKLRILHLEDVSTDAELVERELKKGHFRFESLVVANKIAFERALIEFEPDLIIADHTLPSFDSVEAMGIMKQRGIEIPIILVTATISDEYAVEIMKAGADDYILKDRMHRLPQAVLNAMEKYRLKKAKQLIIDDLINSQLHLKEAQEIAKLGSWEIDLQTYEITWSEETHGIFETDPSTYQVTFEGFLSFVPAEYRIQLDTALENSLNSTSNGFIEHKIILQNGKLKYITHNWKTFKDLDGKPLRAVGTSQDITEKKLAEKEITKLSLVARKTSNAVIITDAEEKIQWVNDAFIRMTGFEINEILGKTPGSFLQGPETDPEVVRFMHEKISNKEPFKCDIINYTKSGDKFWTNIECQPKFDSTGKLTGFFSIQTDITKEKEAEQAIYTLTERMTLATKAAKLGIWDWDIVKDTMTWDDRMYELYGIERKEFFSALSDWGNCIHPDDYEKANKDSKDALAGIRDYEPEFRVVWPDKSVHYLKGNAVVICDATGKPVRMIGLNFDITEKKRLEGAVETERNQFFEMFSRAPAAIGMLKGPNHIVEMANPSYLRFIGKRNIVGKTMLELLPGLLPKGFDESFIDLLDKVYNTGETYFGTERFIQINNEGKGEMTDLYINYIYQAFRNGKGDIAGVFFFINDITEQILSRQDLERSEQQYRQIVETTQEGIWQLDENNKITFVNKNICEILEYSEEEMLGKEHLSFMEESEKQKAIKAIERRKEGIPESYKLTFISKSGKHILTNVSATPIFDEKGNYSGALGMVSDITDKKKLEELLEEASKLARIGSFELDCRKDIMYWSLVTKEIHEVALDYIPTLKDGIAFYKEGDSRDKMNKAYKNAVNDNISYDLELQIITANGNERWIRKIGRPTFVDGKCARINGSFQDITPIKNSEIEALKASEEKEIVLESIGDAFIMVDTNWNVTYWNQHAANFLQCSRAEIINKNIWERFPDAIQTKFFSNYHKAVLEQSVVNFEEYYEGVSKWFEVTAYPSNSGLSIYFRDVTSRKETQLQVIELNKNLKGHTEELVQRNSDLEQFSYIVSHNLRAPVANILGLGDLLGQEDYTQEMKNDFQNALLDNVKRLDLVITDLNSILQVKGKINAKKQSVVLNDLVDAIKNSIQNLVDKENVNITTDFRMPVIHTVQSYMHSIFYNLIANSIKYHQPEIPAEIAISSELKDGFVVITFKDNGLGIDLDKKRGQVFILYKRFHHHVEGKGMGLFLVKTQVELLGGKIAIESKVNDGTTFTVTFEERIFNTINEDD